MKSAFPAYKRAVRTEAFLGSLPFPGIAIWHIRNVFKCSRSLLLERCWRSLLTFLPSFLMRTTYILCCGLSFHDLLIPPASGRPGTWVGFKSQRLLIRCDCLLLPISLLPLLIWNFHLRRSCSRLFTKDGLEVSTGSFLLKKIKCFIFLVQKDKEGKVCLSSYHPEMSAA